MSKIQFSDVVPPGKRSIRNVPIPDSGKRKSSVIIKPEGVSASRSSEEVSGLNHLATEKTSKFSKHRVNSEPYEYYYPKNNKVGNQQADVHDKSLLTGPKGEKWAKRKHLVFGTITIGAIIVFVVGMMTIFASATILITPKSQETEVSMNLVGAIKSNQDSVRYEVIRLSRSKTLDLPATGEESVELKARGKIIIYNNFSTSPQRLIARTRFESSEGLIYRISESIVVPGQSMKDGNLLPGSIEVEVFADEPGEKYNLEKSDFTIPGFKDDSNRYENFYARSSTEIEGGFVGKIKTVSADEKYNALQNIDSEIQIDLKKELQAKVPEGLVMLTDSFLYHSRELPQQDTSSSVILGKEVTAYAILLNKSDLSDKIVSQYLKNYPEWENIPAIIKDFSLLKMIERPGTVEFGEKMEFKIAGAVQILADIDADMISKKLVGMPKKEISKLLNEFKGISSMTVTIKPIWKRSFPDNPLKINVKMAEIN